MLEAGLPVNNGLSFQEVKVTCGISAVQGLVPKPPCCSRVNNSDHAADRVLSVSVSRTNPF